MALTARERRRELRDLLRSRRERLQPEDVGLPRGERRRARGLRREEVALLSGISPSWYTWLEQGRDIQPSIQVLRRIGSTLRLSSQELTYLLLLSGCGPGHVPARPTADAAAVLPALLENFTQVPAVLYNRRFDVLSANPAARAVYGADMDAQSRWERNMLWRFFMDAERRRMYPDATADRGIRNLVEALRISWADSGESDEVRDLVDHLRCRSRDFDILWREHRVADLTTVTGRVRPRISDEVIAVRYTRLSVHGMPHHAIAALVPAGKGAADALGRYLDHAC